MVINQKNINIIKFLSAIVLMIIAIALYIFIHGTKELFLFQKINSIKNIIPMFEGTSLRNKFLTGYCVDILWFTAFQLTYSFISKKHYSTILVLIYGIILESIQFFFPIFGTFDFWDIAIYSFITLIFLFITFIIKIIKKAAPL